MARAKLFAIGGAHIDRRGRVRGPYVAEASNPGTMREDVGGGAFNAARVAAQRGLCVSLLSLRGGDAAGQQVAEAIEESGIEDCSAIFLDRATPSYTAILTEDGNLVTGLADMGLYEIGFSKQLRRRKIRDAVGGADAVLCDANLPGEALSLLAELAADKPMFAIGISPAKVERMVAVLDKLRCLFINQREARQLAGLPANASIWQVGETLAARGLKTCLISAGGAPLIVMEQGRFLEIVPPAPARLTDVTGAGDALAGASLAAMLRGLPLAEAAREGIAAAKIVVESERAAPRIDEAAFRAALALVPQPRIPEQEKL